MYSRVLCIHMALQTLHVGILLAADLTDTELVSAGGGAIYRVVENALVTVELLRPGKALAARVTRVRTLTRVRTHMFLQR